MGAGEALLEVDPADSIKFDLVVGKTLETALDIRNPRNRTIVFKVLHVWCPSLLLPAHRSWSCRSYSKIRPLCHYSLTSSPEMQVKTTAPKRYCVKPNCCLLKPGENVEVKIIMQALKEIPPVPFVPVLPEQASSRKLHASARVFGAVAEARLSSAYCPFPKRWDHCRSILHFDSPASRLCPSSFPGGAMEEGQIPDPGWRNREVLCFKSMV
jgi:hypothetical protein